MRNIRLKIEYDGLAYAGWQVQNRHPAETIQGLIEKTLQKILKEKIRLIGSGRTDAGVSALAQTANFKTFSDFPIEKIKGALNALLPDDIAILGAKEVCAGFHAIRDVKSKLYRYQVLNRSARPALLRDRVYFCPFPLDVKLMRDQARALVGRHDFKAFCASGSSALSTVRTVNKITIKKSDPLVIIDIEADGFLYNMVRNIVGTLIEIGRGKFKKTGIKEILRGKNRRLAGPCAPAQGLCLVKVNY